VIGSPDDDAIDILLLQELAVVVVDAPRGMALGRRILAALPLTVGDGYDLRFSW
jgi:hypothetical protein